MAYSLISTPENSWHILNSDHSVDVSKYIGDENIQLWGGTPNVEFQNDYTTKKFFKDETLEYNKLSQDEKNLVDNYISQNGHIDCEQVFKKESKQLGIREQSCNPVTKGMDADYVLIYIASERIAAQGSTDMFFYTLDGGADESKKAWFMKISNHNLYDFV